MTLKPALNLYACLLCSLLLGACATPTPTPTVAPTAAQPTVTALAPTPAQSTPAATNPLNAQGPWLVYTSNNGALVALNPNGTARTVVAASGPMRPSDFVSLFISPAPNDGWFAFWQVAEDGALNLQLLQLPAGEAHTLPLYSAEQLQDPLLAQLVGAGTTAPAWAPNGQALAYSAAPAGVPGLYVYHLASQASTQLVDTAGAWVSNIGWSPQGDWLLYQTQTFEQGLRVWAVPVTGGPSHELLAVSAADMQLGGVGYRSLGWPSAQQLLWLTQPYTTEHIASTLQLIDFATTTRTTRFNAGPYREAAYDLQSGVIALIEADGGEAMGPDYLALLAPNTPTPARLPLKTLTAGAGYWANLYWWPNIGRFSAVGVVENPQTFESQHGVVLIAPDGTLTELPNANNALDAAVLPAPDGQWVAVYGVSSLLRLYTLDGTPGPVLAPAIDGPGVGAVLWASDSTGLYFIGGDTALYYVADLQAQPVPVAQDLGYVLDGVLNAGHPNWGWVR